MEARVWRRRPWLGFGDLLQGYPQDEIFPSPSYCFLYLDHCKDVWDALFIYYVDFSVLSLSCNVLDPCVCVMM